MQPEERVSQYAQRQWVTAERTHSDLVALAHHLVGIQAQIPTTPATAAQARIAGVTPGSVRQELAETRRLVRTWTVRGTMHLVDAQDLPLLRTALRPEWEQRWSLYLNRHATRAQREVAGRAVMAVLEAGPATRAELELGVQEYLGVRAEWLSDLFSSWGGVLKDLAYAEQVLHGPERNGETLFVRTRDWITLPEYKGSADEALAEVLQRYLAAYGPSTLQDFVYWSGVTVARAKRASALVSDSMICTDGYLSVPNPKPKGQTAHVRLLPKFDPYIMAHKEKFYLPTELRSAVFRPAGDVSAVVLLEGVVVGTWHLEGAEQRRRITWDIRQPLSPDDLDCLHAETDVLCSWINRSGEPQTQQR